MGAGSTQVCVSIEFCIVMRFECFVPCPRRIITSPEAYLGEYVTFMQTPGSHNDTYCSTAHRMFFANLVEKKLPPHRCLSTCLNFSLFQR